MEDKKILVNKKMTDDIKWKVITMYIGGASTRVISEKLSVSENGVSDLIRDTTNSLNNIREMKGLVKRASSVPHAPSSHDKIITAYFLAEAERQGEMYAYYYTQTMDNKFALDQSGLSSDIPKGMRKHVKDYTYNIRGQYIRNIPSVKEAIRLGLQDRSSDHVVEKAHVQLELMRQIEELKALAAEDPKHRTNLLKSIELLGRSLGTFTDRIQVEETDATTGLEKIMERAKKEGRSVTVVEKDE